MVKEKIMELTVEEKRRNLKEWLDILDETYGVKMTFIARQLDIQIQNLHNFKKGKQTLSVEKLFSLERFLIEKYGILLIGGSK